MNSITLASGELQTTISLDDPHGWVGLARLQHRALQHDWLLSPAITLEHYIGVPMQAPEYIQYEPCCCDKQFIQHGESTCTLRYEPLPCSQVSTEISYTLVAPHYVDVQVQVSTTRAEWPYSSLALFFATIVQAPIYAGILFPGKDLRIETQPKSEWVSFNGYARTAGNTAHAFGAPAPELRRPEPAPATYYYSDSSLRFTQPFFYATIDDLCFAVLFKDADRQNVHFTVNPIAPAFGGPAWDFFWHIDDPAPGKPYRLEFRVMLKPFAGSADVLGEYQHYNTTVE